MIVIWTATAEVDRHRIWMFLAQRSIKRADRAEARVEQRVAGLELLPYLGRPVGGDRRELSIPDEQLVVRYRVDEDAVRILQLWSTRENRNDA